MDQNGRKDLVLAGDLKEFDIIWYKFPIDITDISAWEKHVVYRNDTHRTYHVETGDMDGDGYIDIVFGTKTDNSIGWLENIGLANNWPAVIIDTKCYRCFKYDYRPKIG